MRGIRRSLSVPIGITSALLLAWPMAAAALATLDAPSPLPVTALQRSGAGDLMVAYQEALVAHLDAVLGNDAAAAADLHAASEHLSLAQQAVASRAGISPGAPGAPERHPGSPIARPVNPGSSNARPANPGSSNAMPGGGGGPGTMTTEPGTDRILGALHSLAEDTQSDISADSTTRLVAAMTGELVRLGRMGGGGGPGGQAVSRQTAIEHIGEAYALVGQSQSDVAMRDYAEARGALDQASRHLDAALESPGGSDLAQDINQMNAAVKDAEGPVAAKSPAAAEATMRAVRELTIRLSAMAASSTSQGGESPSGG